MELAEVFAAEVLLASDDTFAVEAFLGDARVVVVGDFEELPDGRLVGVVIAKETPFVAGDTEEREVAASAVEEFVGDEAGFVTDQDVCGEPAGGFGGQGRAVMRLRLGNSGLSARP